MAERILVVEDDVELGGQIVARLEREGYQVTWWREGRRITSAVEVAVELVVLDLMLPGSYGLDVLRELRALSEVPVLVLSARNDSADKVRALRLGADDYMTKPFWPEELVERVRARLRRPVLLRKDVVEVGSLHIDLTSREVTVEGERVELTRAEYAFLTALARRPGVPVSRATLAEHVLDQEGDASPRTLDVHASRLRKKLRAPELIQTVWGVGYRLAKPTP